MKKYRCPKCNNSSTTSYCCECEENIPMSCAYDEEEIVFKKNISDKDAKTVRVCRKCGRIFNAHDTFCTDCGSFDSDLKTIKNGILMDKPTKKWRMTPSGNYGKIFFIECINPDIAYALSSILLNEDEDEKYIKGFIIRRVVLFIVLVIVGVYAWNQIQN